MTKSATRSVSSEEKSDRLAAEEQRLSRRLAQLHVDIDCVSAEIFRIAPSGVAFRDVSEKLQAFGELVKTHGYFNTRHDISREQIQLIAEIGLAMYQDASRPKGAKSLREKMQGVEVDVGPGSPGDDVPPDSHAAMAQRILAAAKGTSIMSMSNLGNLAQARVANAAPRPTPAVSAPAAVQPSIERLTVDDVRGHDLSIAAINALVPINPSLVAQIILQAGQKARAEITASMPLHPTARAAVLVYERTRGAQLSDADAEFLSTYLESTRAS